MNTISKECASYCLRGIVQYLNGDTNKFNALVDKAIQINQKEKEVASWTNCTFKVNGKKVKAKINMLTHEIKDLNGNTLKEGIAK